MWMVELVFFCAPEKVSEHVTGQFATKPFNSWIKMSLEGKAHMELDYHQAGSSSLVMKIQV